MKILRNDYIRVDGGNNDVEKEPPPPPGLAKGGLSVVFTIMCIVDLFGVFPVITLPKSVISCGIYGIPMVISVIGLQLYTAVLLGRSWLLAQEITPLIKEKNRYPYAAVAELAFGPAGRRAVTFILNATVFGSGIPNFILAAQSLQIFWWKVTGGGVGITYCVWMLILALLLCPVMWLGSPKDMKPVAVTSICIVSTVALSTWICILLDDTSPRSTGTVMDYTPQIGDFLGAYGILAFQFDIHPMLLTIQVDMRDSTQINKAVVGGFISTVTMFTVTALLAANRYGMDVDNNILQGIPPSIPLYIVALLVTVQLCLSSAVGNSVLFQQIEDLLRVPRNFCIQRILIRSGIVALGVFLAETVPRFDLVMGLVGSTLTGPLMFIFPPIFFLKLCYIKSKMRQIDPIKTEKAKGKTNGVAISQNGDDMSKAPLILPQNGDDVSKAPLIIPQNGDDVSKAPLTIPQNGDEMSKPLILSENLRQYRTFSSYKYKKFDDEDDEYTIKWYDVMLALIVMTMGIAATVVATYSSWANSIAYATYSPPCLLNATIAARSFLDMALN